MREDQNAVRSVRYPSCCQGQPHLTARKHDDATLHPNRSSWATHFAAAVRPTWTLRCGPIPFRPASIGTASIGSPSFGPAIDPAPFVTPAEPPAEPPAKPPAKPESLGAPEHPEAFAPDALRAAFDATPDPLGTAIDAALDSAPEFDPAFHASIDAAQHTAKHAAPHVQSTDDAQHAWLHAR